MLVTVLVTEMLRCEQKNTEFLLVTCDYCVTHASIVTMLGTRLVVSQCMIILIMAVALLRVSICADR